MENKANQKLYSQLMTNEDFFKKYMYSFADRFIYSSVDLEDTQDKNKKIILIKDLMKAIHKSLEFDSIKSPYDIMDIANIVNYNEGLEGFRKTTVDPGDFATFVPSKPKMIMNDLYYLLSNYNNIWCDLTPFEREARFHIEFMRIHPFEDGNKRTGRIILNSNLHKNNTAPIIIRESDTKDYYRFINERDYEGFAEFIRIKSTEELSNIIGLYKTLYDVPVEESIYDNLTEERKPSK